jgi:hypothetical protein
MKTIVNTISKSLVVTVFSILLLASCKKEVKNDSPSSADNTASAAKTSAAIDARVGTFTITGTVDGNIFTAADGKQITISKIGQTKIKIAPLNFTMAIIEFEVKNGASVSNGVVSGSEDGKAIGYTGSSNTGTIVFGCAEDNEMALVVSGSSDISIAGSK